MKRSVQVKVTSIFDLMTKLAHFIDSRRKKQNNNHDCYAHFDKYAAKED